MVYYTEKRQVMDWQIWAAVLPVIAGIVGVWVNLNSTVARLKSRVMQLEISQDEFKQIAKELPYPKMLNMFWSGKTPVLDTKQLEALGFDMAIVPSDLQRIAIAAMSRAAREIINFGHTKELANQMATFQEREAAINSEFFNELDKRYSIG